MNVKQVVLFFLLLISFHQYSFSQSKGTLFDSKNISFYEPTYSGTDLPESKYDAVISPFLNFLDMENFSIGLSWGYMRTSFLNKTFGQNISNKYLSRKFGNATHFSLTQNPITFDVGYLSSGFDYNGQQLKYKAWEFSVDYNFIDNYLYPLDLNLSVGFGFHKGKIVAPSVFFENVPLSQTLNKSFFWKIRYEGQIVNLFFTPVQFRLEYRQSLKLDADAFNELYFGLAFNHNWSYWGEMFEGIGQIAGKGGSSVSDVLFWGDARDYKEETMLTYSYGYHQTSFISSNFRANMDSDTIKRTWGHALNFRYHRLYPLMVDVGYFSSIFNVNAQTLGWNSLDTVKIRHRGVELAADLPLLSIFEKFIPYAGAGFQISQLTNKSIWDSGKKLPMLMRVNTNSVIWKAGFMVNLIDYSTVITVEYKHSMFNRKTPFYQFLITAGWTMGDYY